MDDKSQTKPTCNVRGMIEPEAMCGSVIVGMKYCGFKGDCQHKSTAEMIVNYVKEAQIAKQQTNGGSKP